MLGRLRSYNQRIRMKSKSPCKAAPAPLGEDKLKIIIRIRPVLNEEDPNMFVQLEDNDTIEIRRPGNHSFMRFNNILPPESTQKDVFELVQDSVKQFLKGVNTTIFAYGQTGAGKTYSMIGNYSPTESHENLFNFLSSKERGVLSRSLELIMGNIGKEPNCKIYVSFFEIYNEKIYDLYNNNLVSLDIRESKNGQISIPELVNVQVTKMQEAIEFLMIGLKNRVTGSTHANAKSSRSHSIFQISLERENSDGPVSSLRIVDLAGSEKFKIPSDLSHAQKQTRIQELTSINGSLSCLGHCISALIEKSRTHIPFRNSKLTRILSDSLLGQGKMRFIICISPSVSAGAETFSTLQFANRAKKAIFERVQLKTSSIIKKNSESDQIALLHKQIEIQKEGRVCAERQLIQITRQNQLLRRQNQLLTEKCKANQINQRGSRSIEKDSSPQKIRYYDQNKENGFKQEMLKLTIFQKKNLNSGVSTPPPSYDFGDPCQSSSKSHLNKKKAQFEKKIKKFIESDSPQRPRERKISNEYSFDDQANNGLKPLECSDRNLWDTQKEDSAEFIQKACKKMNMPEFNELKSEMERAKQQLLNLRRKDNELEQRKVGLR